MSYCTYLTTITDTDNVHRHYHDTEYGFPLHDDNALFERLMLEVNQAGLSWNLILKKAAHFHRAFDGYDVATVAAYTTQDRQRLLADAGIIRNRHKIEAAIENANRMLNLQLEYGSFEQWLDQHHPLSLDEWVKTFKKTFKFTGPEIVNEFLISTGYLPGAHDPDCPVYKKILKLKPAWLAAK